MDKSWLKAELPVEEREELLLKKMNLNGKTNNPGDFKIKISDNGPNSGTEIMFRLQK